MKRDDSITTGSPSGIGAIHAPKGFYVNAIKRMNRSGRRVEGTYSKEGRVRTLGAINGLTGIIDLPFEGNCLAHAKKFISTPSVSQALGLRNVTLVDGTTTPFPFGPINLNRVEMRQVVQIGDRSLPVRGGFVHVSMDDEGKVVNVTNTVKYGKRPATLPKDLLSDEQVINACKTKLGNDAAIGTSRLVLSEDKGKFGLVYEVTLTVDTPRQVMFYLVLARTGEIVYETSLIRTSVASPAQDAVNRIPVKCFLAIPNPKKPIAPQVVDHFLESLPDAKVLKDDRFIMYVKEGGKWIEVKAKDDGSFNFDSEKESSKFSAVVTYVAMRAQYEFLEGLGMRKQTKPIKVFIDDPDVRDNAYFDGFNYEIHMGIGSGGSFGLAVHISFDLGVEWHENGHHVVFLQTPGQDLGGSEGGAMHESTGDVLGQLVMQYLWWVLYGEKVGVKITVDTIKKHDRVIGPYCAGERGIREQRTKRTPKNKTGEVHDDGLISGSTHADLLEGMIVQTTTNGGTILEGITDFARLYLAALALVPAHTVRFSDMLRAMMTADNTLYKGKYQALVVATHKDHGIVLPKAADEGEDEPTIDIDVEGAGDTDATKGDGIVSKGPTTRRRKKTTTGRGKKTTTSRGKKTA